MATCLVIRALSLNDQALSQPIHGVFDENGGSIGRADTNTMTLPDPERLISRLHARVSWDRDEFWIQDVGHGVGSLLNGRPIGGKSRVQLKARDELRIGGYRLMVDDVDEAAADLLRQRTITQMRSLRRAEAAALEALLGAGAAGTGPQGINPDAYAGPGAPPASSPDPFADLLRKSGPERPMAASDPDRFGRLLASDPSEKPAAGSAGRDVAPARLPDDFDPFADPPRKAALKHGSEDPLALVGASAGHGDIDRIFGLADPRGKDPLEGFVPADPAPIGQAPLDPLAMLQAPVPVPQAPAPNHTPELKGAFRPPRAVAGPKSKSPPKGADKGAAGAVPKPANDPAPGPHEASIEELWRHFLDGAGLPPSVAQTPTPYLMYLVGSVLREMTEGVLQLLAARAAGKNQLRAEVTVIQARDNNPFKFSPNVRSALSQLLQPTAAGFLTAPEAVRDAMKDLRTHQIGTMAGTRAALESLVARFDPNLVEKQLPESGAMDTLMPSLRRARLWDLYLQHFATVMGEGGENLQQQFAKAFVTAYEEQVARLERGEQGEGSASTP